MRTTVAAMASRSPIGAWRRNSGADLPAAASAAAASAAAKAYMGR